MYVNTEDIGHTSRCWSFKHTVDIVCNKSVSKAGLLYPKRMTGETVIFLPNGL
jgi:hypothetical protein